MLIGTGCLYVAFPTTVSAEELPADVDLPLHYRTPHQRVLLNHKGGEIDVAVEACKANGLKHELLTVWDFAAQDYSGVHTIIAGSKFMDRFGTEIGRKPESFEPLAKFVRDGGHLFLYGNYNGRHSQHLRQFGIKTGVYHGKTFVQESGRGEVLFDGFEDTIPEVMTVVCNLGISTDHVVMLRRGPGRYEGALLMGTLTHGQGRVTILPCQPNWRKEYWIMPIVVRWIANDSPTSLRQKGATALLSERLSRVFDTSLPQIADGTLKAAEGELKKTFSNSYQRATDIAGKDSLAQKLAAHALKEISDLEKVATFRQAAIYFASVADVKNALAALSDRAGLHQLNLPAEQAEMLALAATNLSTLDECVELATSALNLSEDAEDLLEFSAALSLAQTAEIAATKSRTASLLRLSKSSVKRLRRFRFEADWVEDHTQQLGTESGAGKSSSAIGRFYCLMVDDWTTGLPYLSVGDDQTLRELVELESATDDEATKHEAVGDQWLKFARTASTHERQSAARRARFWFRQCLATVSQMAFSEAAVSRIE
jgi:hypothetical protein